MEKISIVVPVNNAASYLRQCLDSILSQEFQDFKLILINDGSTDESGSICRRYAGQDDRIVIYHQRGQGVGTARNKGIELAEGKYIMFIDPNDWIEPNLLGEIYDMAEAAETDWIIWSLRKCIYDTRGRLITSKNMQATELNCKTESECKNEFLTMVGWGDILLDATWNKLYKRKIIKEHQINFAAIHKEQDIIFNLEYFKHCRSLTATPKIYSNLQLIDKGYEDRTLQAEYERAYFNHLRYRQLLDFWRKEKEVIDIVDYNFLMNIFTLMKKCMKSEWKLSFFKKYRYIKTLMKKIEVKEVAKDITHTNYPGGIRGRVVKTKITCIQKQKVLRLLIIHYIENIFSYKKQIKQVDNLS